MSDTATKKQRTITLTGRPPVRILEECWPLLAQSRHEVDSHNGTPLPSYECARWDIRVRRHEDGRAIVYAVADAPSASWQTHGCRDWKGGELVAAGADLIKAIQRVGEGLVEEGGAPRSVVRECIANLPAEDL